MSDERRASFARSLFAAALAAAACSGPAHELVLGSDAERPRIRFLDGSISLNDRCPVSGSRLNRRMDPLYVNGRSIGFC